MNKPLAYIIDLDGTLYDNSHRQHLIPADRSNTAGWVEFNCACADDVLREDMSDLVRSVLLSGREVIYLTGRSEVAGKQTMQRLLKDFNFIEQPTLIMRPMDCHASAAEFKRDAVKRIRDSKRWAGYDLIALEDDPSIVEVMRGMGVTVLHIDSKCCAVKKPHHNGMMQLSNELAEVKAVLQQRNGECDRLITEKQALENQQANLVMIVKMLTSKVRKNHPDSQLAHNATAYLQREGLISPADCLRDELSGNTEQLDTAPAQFESLAGEPVSEPYKLRVIGWARTDYQDENRKGDAPLFIFGKKDPSATWGVPYLRVGNYPEIPEGSISAAQFVKDYCAAGGISEAEFYETQVPMPDSTSPSGWAAVTNSPLHIKAHVDLYVRAAPQQEVKS